MTLYVTKRKRDGVVTLIIETAEEKVSIEMSAGEWSRLIVHGKVVLE